MVQWTTFAGITGVVLVLLLVLSHLTQSAVSDSAPDSTSRSDGATSNPYADESAPDAGADASLDADGAERTMGAEENEPRPSERGPLAAETARHDRRQGLDPDSLSTGELLANVALSQGLFAFVLLGAVLYTGIPADALGVEFSRAYVAQGAVWGTAVGLALYVANELGAATATRLGFDHDEELRSMLAPDALRGWLVLLLIVLPIIAFFEELLFRAALIGVVSSGFSISPWLLAAVSSVAFALGHGMQGSVGIVVTGVLGFVLAAVFVVTGSFLVVVVAHYLINALEFVVHEGLGFDWAETLES